MAAALQDGVRLSQTSPAFLHANSTSHTWIFSAIAELIDNAYDPDVAATVLWIGKKVITKNVCLVFQDNGAGMHPEKLHRMLSFGYCEKVTINGHRPVGHYGNGFKSGSMRLGKDAIVFTKSTSTMSVGFLSQTYLKAIKAETVLVPIVSWDIKTKKRIKAVDSEGSLRAITTHSLFKHEEVLLQELEAIGGTGTRIILYNLKRGSDNKLELDFESNPIDIINSEHMEMDLSNTYRPVREDVAEYRRSLREYCSILFLKPRMKIFIRGTKVKTKLVAKSLSKTETDFYRPTWLSKPVKIIFGFGPRHQHLEYGVMMYHRNRLIKAYEKVGYQKQANELGVGVVGVVEVDFLEPIHNKQDFNKSDRYNASMNALTMKLNDYWNAKMGTGTTRVVSEERATPDWTWVQCDNCLKWRRLLDGVERDSLPDKWFCYMNRDPRHNRCDIEEEPEDEDELFRNSNYQREKSMGRKVKEREKKSDIQKILQKEHFLQQKEQELIHMKHQIERMQPLDSPGRGNRADKKPTVADLEKAKLDLIEAQKREAQQRAVIQQLQTQKNQIEQQQSVFRNRMMQEVMSKNNSNAPSGASKRKSTGPLKVALFSNKKARVEAQGPDFIVTRNESDSEEDPNKNGAVIVLDSDSEDEAEKSKGKGKGKGKGKKSSTSEDVKPDKEKLDQQMQEQTSEEGTSAKATSTSKNSDSTSMADSSKNSNSTASAGSSKKSDSTSTAGSSSSKEKSSDTLLKGTKLINRLVQTLPVEFKEGGKGKDSGDTSKVKKELQKTKSKLNTLRKHVMQLLQIIVPDIDLGEMDTVDEVVVEMIRVNGGEKELESRSVSPTSKSGDGEESENEENKDESSENSQIPVSSKDKTEPEKDDTKDKAETKDKEDMETCEDSTEGVTHDEMQTADPKASPTSVATEKGAVDSDVSKDSSDSNPVNENSGTKSNTGAEVPMDTEENSTIVAADSATMDITEEYKVAETVDNLSPNKDNTQKEDVSADEDKDKSEVDSEKIDNSPSSNDDQNVEHTAGEASSEVCGKADIESNDLRKTPESNEPDKEGKNSCESLPDKHSSSEDVSSRRNSQDDDGTTCQPSTEDKISSRRSSAEHIPSPTNGRNSPAAASNGRDSDSQPQKELAHSPVENGVSPAENELDSGKKTPNSEIGTGNSKQNGVTNGTEHDDQCAKDGQVKSKNIHDLGSSDVVDLLDDDEDEDDVLIVESKSHVKVKMETEPVL